jgi:hypothetical protein
MKNFGLRQIVSLGLVASAAMASAQSTAFLQWDRRFHSFGAWTVQKFTLSAKRNLVLRVASDWKADVAVIPSSQLNRFKNGQSFTGWGYDDSFGCKDVNLSAGTYYLAARNQVSGSNFVRVELDYQTKVTGWNFQSWGVYDTNYLDSGYNYWQKFTILPNARYFIDGANTGLDTYVMDAKEVPYFDRGDDFYYYKAYSRNTTDMPGFYELKLKPGQYALGFINDYNEDSAFTYEMELFTRGGNIRNSLEADGVAGAVEQSGGVVIPRKTMSDAVAAGDVMAVAKFTRATRPAKLMDILKVSHPVGDQAKPIVRKQTGLERLFGATSTIIR